MTRIPHTAPGDLSITLRSPSGKELELSTGNGGTAVNAFNGTTWDDGADPDGLSTDATNDGLVTDHGYAPNVVASPLVPQEALALLAGDAPNGLWTLTIQDLAAQDSGILDEWSLSIAIQGEGAGSTPVVSASGGAMTVPDGGTATTTATFSTRDVTVSSLVVRLGTFAYDGLGDLTLTLRSPSGTTATMTSRNGDAVVVPPGLRNWRSPSGAFVGFGFPDPISRLEFGLAPPPTSVAPEESFGAFVGEDPNGIWTLSATDAGLLPGAGTIGPWSIETAGVRCAGDAMIALTASTLTPRIGERMTYVATVSSIGPGAVTAVTVRLNYLPWFRVVNIDAGPGSVCSAGPLRSCRWDGPTPPGTQRTIHLTGEHFYGPPGPVTLNAGLSVQAVQKVDMRSTIPLTISRTALSGVVTLPSALRAFNGSRCTVTGTEGADDFRAMHVWSPARHVLCGFGGDDTMFGTALRDVIDGGSGNDNIFAGSSDDHVDGGPGRDLIRGGSGNDRIAGGTGVDLLIGGSGADELRGGPGRDRLVGGPSRDHLFGGPGADVLSGGPGIDFGRSGPGDRLVGIERVG